MITLHTISRRTKPELANAIARELAISLPPVSTGSSVDTRFLERANEAITGRSLYLPNAYVAAETLLTNLGLEYDRRWDTSEAQIASGGGGTVTARTYSKALVSLAGQPRCFVVSLPWHEIKRGIFQISNPKTRNALIDAGTGSLLLFGEGEGQYRRLIARGLCTSVQANSVSLSVWNGPWTVSSDNEVLPRPEPFRVAPVVPSVFEVDPSALPSDWTQLRRVSQTSSQAEEQAKRIFRRLLDGPSDPQQLRIPPEVQGLLSLAPEMYRAYTDFDPHEVTEREAATLTSPSPIQRYRSKAIELRAVKLAIESLVAAGWTLTADLQSAGVGYDFEFTHGSRVLHVEVKGLQGERLNVNLTAKELWRARTDPNWVLIAVTRALVPSKETLHVVDRQSVCRTPRRATSYEMNLDSPLSA